MSLLTKVTGDPTKREVRKHRATVEEINSYEDDLKALSDAELGAKTQEFRDRLGVEGPDLSLGQSYPIGLLGEEDDEDEKDAQREDQEAERERKRVLDDLLPEAFAVVREASRRTLGMRPFDVQLIGGTVLHQGRIAEMRTGEGKTLVATLPLYLNALEGRGAHLVTVNDYLARRDAGWNAPLYHLLGMTVGIIAGENMSYVYDPDFTDTAHPDPRLQHLRPVTRREAYAADITYATNNELGFDYLRDNMAPSLEVCVQRRLNYAIVDEVDSILIDEARTPLIISGQSDESTDLYYTYARLIPQLVEEDDYTIDEKARSAALTEEGMAKIEKWTGIANVYDLEHVAEAHQINQALRAHALYLNDREYIVKDGEVIIVDEFTGRTMPGRRWSDGLHSAIEAKEGVKVQQEQLTLASITFQNFFRLYRKLAGMTGTAITEAEEFHKIYHLDVVPIPPHRPAVRNDEPDLIFSSEEAKFKAVADEIAERHAEGQPILVGTTSIDKSERLSRLLNKRGIVHSVLNAKLHEQEATVVAAAGKKGVVTIATNMAGRGTDIVLGEGVTDVGGLYIIGTERHDSRRIDNQLRGRSGRQGDPGETRFFLSFEDDLLRIFGGERMQGIMNRFGGGDDIPIESKMVTKRIEGAQARVEGHRFDERRNVVEYDDVISRQREVIYGERRKILEGTDTRDNILRMVERIVADEVPAYCSGKHRDGWDFEGLWERMRFFAPLPEFPEVDIDSLGDTPEQVAASITEELKAMHEEKERSHGEDVMRQVERMIMLNVIDNKWRGYLTQVDHLREGIGLQAYGQKDPLLEFKTEAFGSFQELTADIQADIVRMLFHTKIEHTPPREPGNPGAAPGGMVPPPGSGPGGATPDAPHPGGSGTSPTDVPPARPGAADASGRLAAATARNRMPQPPGMPSGVRNVVETSAAGTRQVAGTASRGGTATSAKVGRNDPCPCGSGKKYKRCHGG